MNQPRKTLAWFPPSRNPPVSPMMVVPMMWVHQSVSTESPSACYSASAGFSCPFFLRRLQSRAGLAEFGRGDRIPHSFAPVGARVPVPAGFSEVSATTCWTKRDEFPLTLNRHDPGRPSPHGDDGGMARSIRSQQIYDHRLKDLVQETGDIKLAVERGVPPSTARGWLSSTRSSVVTLDVLDATKNELENEVLTFAGGTRFFVPFSGFLLSP